MLYCACLLRTGKPFAMPLFAFGVLGLLLLIVYQGRTIMASVAELTAVLARVDTATTGIAEDVRRIKEQVVGGLTAEEAAGIQAEAERLAQRLEALDAENPEGEVPA